MSNDGTDPTRFLPLPTSEFQILLVLVDRPRHGHAIKREVGERTDGDVVMGPGTLYGAIKRMLGSRLIEETFERPDPADDDQRRRYYRITALGRRVAELEARRMLQLLGIASEQELIPEWKAP